MNIKKLQKSYTKAKIRQFALLFSLSVSWFSVQQQSVAFSSDVSPYSPRFLPSNAKKQQSVAFSNILSLSSAGKDFQLADNNTSSNTKDNQSQSSSFAPNTQPVSDSSDTFNKASKSQKPIFKQSPVKGVRANEAHRDKKFKKSKVFSAFQDLILFQWLNEQQVSLQWAYAFLKHKDKYAPDLLKEKIRESFKNDLLFYLNFRQNVIQFPYILKWGIRASAGTTRNEDNDSFYFIPLSLSAIISLQIFEHQFIVPFFEMGYSFWSVDFSESSEFFPFWAVGADISFSIFKNSLRYTLPDEYGINDIGISLEFRNNSSPGDFPEEKTGYFLRSIHAGIYCKF